MSSVFNENQPLTYSVSLPNALTQALSPNLGFLLSEKFTPTQTFVFRDLMYICFEMVSCLGISIVNFRIFM